MKTFLVTAEGHISKYTNEASEVLSFKVEACDIAEARIKAHNQAKLAFNPKQKWYTGSHYRLKVSEIEGL